ncbi:nucleotidyltransferase family protein [Spirosoma sp. KNUC1025]|uniref:nucleotidyltransferase domain-containing protein n=1 Tax=Spirosoma sp. KNUC1025 TaxID=2894082 RepID=UPI00386D5133|nr:nucleotidyltransferase family protein [Spirosoma sp. KNUC1025]
MHNDQHSDFELTLLILCLQRHLGSKLEKNTLINYVAEKQINWHKFLELASIHNVSIIVGKSLNDIPTIWIPNTTASYFRSSYSTAVENHFMLLNELKGIITLFNQYSIPLIPFKGMTIAQFYGNAVWRQSGDLDIIIRKDDIGKAIEVLVLSGYERPNQVYLEDDLERRHSYPFKKGTVVLDLHWNITDESELFCYPIEKVWLESEKELFYGIQAQVLSKKNLIITTCIHHGLRNSWNELRFILDFSIFANDNWVNWEEIVKEAERLKIKRILLVGVSLANTLFRVSIPTCINKDIKIDKKVFEIQELIINKLYKPKSSFHHKFYTMYTRILLRERLVIRLKLYIIFISYWTVIFYKLSVGDLAFNAYKLPRFFHFFCKISSPFFLIYKYLIKWSVAMFKKLLQPTFQF